MKIKKIQYIVSIILFISVLHGQQSKNPEREKISGKWRGSSICVDKKVDVACKDEEVLYEFVPIISGADSVLLHASKYVKGELEPMGDLRFCYSSSAKKWSADYTGRLKIRWSFTVKDSTLDGSVVELPSMRLIRTVSVKRVSK